MSVYYPKDFIRKQLMEELGSASKGHAYFGFILICSGIELLGRCIDVTDTSWTSHKRDGYHFKRGLELFPTHYIEQKTRLYKELRCGMAHSQLPGGYLLTEKANDPDDTYKYDSHLKNGSSIIVWEYIYSDFQAACEKVLAIEFSEDDKMSKPFLVVRPIRE